MLLLDIFVSSSLEKRPIIGLYFFRCFFGLFINSLNNVVGFGISKLVPQNTIMLSILSLPLPINLFTLIIGLDNDIILYINMLLFYIYLRKVLILNNKIYL